MMASEKPLSASLLHVVAVALVDADGRVLLQERPPGGSLPGLWEFPGGKIEPGETPEAALVRELEEELAISTHASCLAPAAFASEALGDRHLVMLLYVCRKWSGIPQARHATALQWLRPAQMYAVPMPKADLPLIGLLDALL
jgi:8-oxo-dGTP diphosphatase